MIRPLPSALLTDKNRWMEKVVYKTGSSGRHQKTSRGQCAPRRPIAYLHFPESKEFEPESSLFNHNVVINEGPFLRITGSGLTEN